jgi:hypothetical protein
MIVIDTIQDSLLKDSFSHVVMSKVEDVPAKTRRNNAWVRLRKRLNRKGVVEVDIDHHKYKMLNMLRTGIRDLLLNHTELGPKVSLYIYRLLSVKGGYTPVIVWYCCL